MRKIALVVSHLGSGSDGVCQILDKNPRVQWINANIIYSHYDSLTALTSIEHKTKDSSAVWLDDILHNYYFTNQALYKFCKFIYVIREAKSSLNWLVQHKYDSLSACRYYTYRLRRICEMARNTGGVLLTWNDLVRGRGLRLLEEYLYLKVGLEHDKGLYTKPKDNRVVSYSVIDYGQSMYERYLYYLKNLGNLRHFE